MGSYFEVHQLALLLWQPANRGSITERSDSRQQPSPKRVQAIGEEVLRLHCGLVVQSIAVEFGNTGSCDNHSFRKAVVQDIQGQKERLAEIGDDSVIGRGLESEEVNLG